jgi:hypothetical protein
MAAPTSLARSFFLPASFAVSTSDVEARVFRDRTSMT